MLVLLNKLCRRKTFSLFLAECVNHVYGDTCSSQCGLCKYGEPCNKLNGTCKDGCTENVQGSKCDGRHALKASDINALNIYKVYCFHKSISLFLVMFFYLFIFFYLLY